VEHFNFRRVFFEEELKLNSRLQKFLEKKATLIEIDTYKKK